MNRCQHCSENAVNVAGNLCGKHVDELRAHDRARHEDYLATMRAEYPFYLEAGDLGISYQDCGPWRSYDAAEVKAKTLPEFLAEVSISEIDQDGGDLACYGFEDAPSEVRAAILKAVGCTEEDV